MQKILFRFPGFVRKTITFTIDDGNVPLDQKFIAITKPAGIRGTFNLCTPLGFFDTADDYRKFYEGYDIGNHCRYHAYPFTEDREVILKDELFPGNETADKAFGYRTEEPDLYRIYTYAWTYLAGDDKYMELVDDCQKELESVFGKEHVHGYIWPCGQQRNPAVFRRLIDYGFQSVRGVRCSKNSTNFAIPEDRMCWTYNADNMCLNEVAELFDSYPDDGGLKFFCFGVHSHDFENAHNWDVLETFAARYGNRPQDFWYSTVHEVFDYEDAVRAVRITGSSITNPSSLDVYAKIDGEKIVIPAGETLNL